jgi:hypothetical protein
MQGSRGRGSPCRIAVGLGSPCRVGVEVPHAGYGEGFSVPGRSMRMGKDVLGASQSTMTAKAGIT